MRFRMGGSYSPGNGAADDRISADVADEAHVGDHVGGQEVVDGVGVWIEWRLQRVSESLVKDLGEVVRAQIQQRPGEAADGGLDGSGDKAERDISGVLGLGLQEEEDDPPQVTHFLEPELGDDGACEAVEVGPARPDGGRPAHDQLRCDGVESLA